MAGLASVLLSQTYYIAPFSGLTPLIKGVSIALCGGLGSVQGAVIAAILLGLVEALTNKFAGRSICPDDPVPRHHPGSDRYGRAASPGLLDKAREQ